MKCYRCSQFVKGRHFHGLHKKCFEEWFGVKGEAAQFNLTLKTVGNSNDPLAHLNSTFFHGKFKKYSARLGGIGYIVKVRQEPFLDLPPMEFLCNQIARDLGLTVPDFYLVKLEGHAEAFISKNFMEKYSDANLIHLYRFMDGKSFDLKNIIQVLLEHTGNYLQIDQFVRVCLFDMLIGNHDRHGRNLALIQTSKGKHLAPFYDNPSYLGIEEDWLLKAVHEPCGKIYTSNSHEPKMYEYAIEFCEFGYASIVRNFFSSIDLQKIKVWVSESFISTLRKEAFFNLIVRRFQEFRKALEFYESNKG